MGALLLEGFIYLRVLTNGSSSLGGINGDFRGLM